MGDFATLAGALDPDTRIRGKQFERIVKWFLQNDPVYRHEIRAVWMWDDWPRRWGADAGIDLVAEDRNGDLWAIQAKAYDPKYRVSKKDVDKFLAESGRKVFTYRMLIATTNLIDRTGERTIQQQEKRSTFVRLHDLCAAAVDWPASPARLRPVKPRTPAKPRPHQAEAIRDVLKGFKTSDRGQLIMACGTGKTLTGLFITEKLECQRTLVLLPSLSLLKQTLTEWRANCTTEFAALPVCSDATVNTADDAAVEHTSDLNVPAETDPEKIAAFLRRKSGPLVAFSTYQSSPQIEAAFKLGRVPGFSLIIADEAHRAAGPVSSDFATVLDSSKIKGSRRLFMTATPRYFTGRVLKAAQDNDFEIASMDVEAKFGPVFHRLSFGNAISRDLLTDYQVAVVAVDDATYREYADKGTLVTRDGKQIDNAATLAGQIGLAKAMRKYDLRRVISFHSRVKSAREFAASMPDIIDWMPARQRPKGALWSDVATGEMPAGDRYVLLQRLGRLNDADRGLLANARCLSEGVDVPTLDGVAFIDPRRSEVDIVQAVGRAIRKSDAKTVGTIVIPVFIDTSEDPDVALESSVFKPVWDVIKALRAHDDELGNQLDTLRREMGRKHGKPTLPDKIHFDLPTTIGRDFASAFDVCLVERTTAPWEFWHGLLQQFADDTGHARVNAGRTIDGYKLGSWVANQRSQYAKGTLKPERERALEGINGWTWNPIADFWVDQWAEQWEEGFSQLVRYVNREKNARVPSSWRAPGGYRLGWWVTWQRELHGKGELDAEREQRLCAMPHWTWDVKADQWEEGFSKLLEYAEQHGEAAPLMTGRIGDFNVGSWVKVQRRNFDAGSLSEDRRTRLEALPGWSWDPFTERWEEGFRRLTDYLAKCGDARVLRLHQVDGFNLGAWVKKQRSASSSGGLSVNRRSRLEALPGWSWDPLTDQWENGFRRLSEYVKDRGTARVPRMCLVDGFNLGSWVHVQRQKYTDGRLESDRQQRLETLPGWQWNALIDKWEEGFRHLIVYVTQHGNAGVPRWNETDDGYRLGAWINTQRNYFKTGNLGPDRQDRLEKLPGWTWDRRADQWEEGFRRLVKYVEGTGSADVPRLCVVDGYGLGMFVGNQRNTLAKGLLAEDRKRRLETLPGWVWNSKTARWDRHYRLLLEYALQHGTCRVPRGFEIDSHELGKWVSQIRYKYTKGKVPPEQMRRLEQVPGWPDK